MIHEPVGKCIVVCEGAADAALVKHLVSRRNLGSITTAFAETPQPGGRQGFSSVLRALKTVRGFESVSKVVVLSDNDVTPTESLREVQDQVRAAGNYGVPGAAEDWAGGRGAPPIGVFMLPRAGDPGDLETLCLVAARAKWGSILACADEYARCTGAATWPVNKRSKMMLRSVLSAVCSTDPNTSLVYLWSRGTAGAQYEIDLHHTCFDGLASFLQEAAS